MKDISSFSASQRMDDMPATLQIDAKQVLTISSLGSLAYNILCLNAGWYAHYAQSCLLY